MGGAGEALGQRAEAEQARQLATTKELANIDAQQAKAAEDRRQFELKHGLREREVTAAEAEANKLIPHKIDSAIYSTALGDWLNKSGLSALDAGTDEAVHSNAYNYGVVSMIPFFHSQNPSHSSTDIYDTALEVGTMAISPDKELNRQVMEGIHQAIRISQAGGGTGTKNFNDILAAHKRIYGDDSYRNDEDKWAAWVEFIVEK